MPPTPTVLVSFTGGSPIGNGIYDSSALIADPAGDLFGTTAGGGPFGVWPGDGTVYEIPYANGGYASTPTAVVNFNGTDGQDPQASLIMDANGNLFGTTQMGGVHGDGTVFEIPYTNGGYASTPTILVTFDNTNGGAPLAGLFADAAGDLFGTTSTGGVNGDGTVFELRYSDGSYASTPTTLISFNDTDGKAPAAILLPDAAGDLFGTTLLGGVNGAGTVFEIAKTGAGYATTPITLVSFGGTNGEDPDAALITDAAGDLFGTTYTGGPGGYGTVFEVPYTDGSYASTPTTLVSFDGVDGQNSRGSLLLDAAGNLFGTTTGEHNDDPPGNFGIVFEVPYLGGSYASTPTTLAAFNGANGELPVGNVITDAAGDLFGTTAVGGANGAGTVYEITDSGFTVCYLAGTQIATPTGDVAVEQLAVGDMVTTLRGQARRIVWVGEGRVLATRGQRSAATPVIVRRGALADNVPHCDLHVTKGHSLYIDDVLIPVEFLVNHRSILWDDRAQEVTIYHIELETHDVLLANGAPAESYCDDGNRWLFQNANSGWGHPGQAPCAPVLTGGPVVDALWRRLLARSAPLGGLPLMDDADVHLLVDGKRVDAIERRGDVHVFRLGMRPRKVSIRSRSAVPQELGLARDERSLGVAIRRIVLAQARRQRVIDADAAALTAGYHAFEAENGIRWTSGDAEVPAELFAGMTGPGMLMLELGAATQYLDDGAVGSRAA